MSLVFWRHHLLKCLFNFHARKSWFSIFLFIYSCFRTSFCILYLFIKEFSGNSFYRSFSSPTYSLIFYAPKKIDLIDFSILRWFFGISPKTLLNSNSTLLIFKPHLLNCSKIKALLFTYLLKINPTFIFPPISGNNLTRFILYFYRDLIVSNFCLSIPFRLKRLTWSHPLNFEVQNFFSIYWKLSAKVINFLFIIPSNGFLICLFVHFGSWRSDLSKFINFRRYWSRNSFFLGLKTKFLFLFAK